MAAGSGFSTKITFEYGEARELSPGVSRIVAPNPGPYTFKGTNTYLVGSRRLAIIDPGPEDSRQTAAILKAAGDREVSYIVITHRHRDHTGGVPALRAATGAPVVAFGPVTFLPPAGGSGQGGSIDRELVADMMLCDGDVVEGDGFALEAVHTPGHLSDHICLRLRQEGILFSGDHVMGWNTSVVAPPNGSMADYLTSLEKLLPMEDICYFPGHGGRISEPRRTVRALILHRQWREEAILESLDAGHTTIEKIVADVYKGLDQRLVRAATLSVQAHIEHLAIRGKVITVSEPAFDSEILLVKP